ncbi:hypothetical protein BDP27DRAFT_1324482 [Rhodocollybia butyracea]|uniref:2-oxoacid dehydrogenase acyltransferase catalytic domain-containing protein n=1 Tax=Rhodocollybia butyracea TaxID=206335 RepID=A0A9P5PWU3_9AGAR|nr:hypothetical protein BDP27DRAFT_1324482 [Rhodocollybia butyracea]
MKLSSCTTDNLITPYPTTEVKQQATSRRSQWYTQVTGDIYLNVVLALKRTPAVGNASVEGYEIVYHNFVGVAIPKGFVTPVDRNVEVMNFVEIEKETRLYWSLRALSLRRKCSTLTVR